MAKISKKTSKKRTGNKILPVSLNKQLLEPDQSIIARIERTYGILPVLGVITKGKLFRPEYSESFSVDSDEEEQISEFRKNPVVRFGVVIEDGYVIALSLDGDILRSSYDNNEEGYEFKTEEEMYPGWQYDDPNWEYIKYQKMTLPVYPQILNQIGNLTHLIGLELESNGLTSLPASFGNLKNLRRLNLGSKPLSFYTKNRLSTLPEFIWNMISLFDLDLKLNCFTSLPDSIGKLQNLSGLDIRGNKLNSLPESIGTLAKLEYLNVENNHLTSLPKTICNLPELKFLILGSNSIKDTAVVEGMIKTMKELEVEGLKDQESFDE